MDLNRFNHLERFQKFSRLGRLYFDFFNVIPADTKQATSLNSFKNLFRTFSFSFILDFVNFVLGFYIMVCNFCFLFGNCILYIVRKVVF